MIHIHVSAWVLALILFFVALSLHKNGKEKGFKVIQMIMRVLYLVILATGIDLLLKVTHLTALYVLKAVCGIWVIGMFEMILTRVANNRRTSVFWVQFVVAFLLVLYLGFVKLPMSIMHP